MRDRRWGVKLRTRTEPALTEWRTIQILPLLGQALSTLKEFGMYRERLEKARLGGLAFLEVERLGRAGKTLDGLVAASFVEARFRALGGLKAPFPRGREARTSEPADDDSG